MSSNTSRRASSSSSLLTADVVESTLSFLCLPFLLRSFLLGNLPLLLSFRVGPLEQSDAKYSLSSLRLSSSRAWRTLSCFSLSKLCTASSATASEPLTTNARSVLASYSGKERPSRGAGNLCARKGRSDLSLDGPMGKEVPVCVWDADRTY